MNDIFCIRHTPAMMFVVSFSFRPLKSTMHRCDQDRFAIIDWMMDVKWWTRPKCISLIILFINITWNSWIPENLFIVLYYFLNQNSDLYEISFKSPAAEYGFISRVQFSTFIFFLLSNTPSIELFSEKTIKNNNSKFNRNTKIITTERDSVIQNNDIILYKKKKKIQMTK